MTSGRFIVKRESVSTVHNLAHLHHRAFFQDQDRPRISQAVFGARGSTDEEAIKAAKISAVAALLDLARAGVGVNSKGQSSCWRSTCLDTNGFQHRRNLMTAAVVQFLSRRSGIEQTLTAENTVVLTPRSRRIAFLCDSVPSSMSTAAARELVGQPFLRDHLIAKDLPKRVGGPVHLIACQKTVTESQAIRQLGFPDAIVVSAPFGIYVADDGQKIQMVFIANCRDDSTTQAYVQRFLQWLDEQSEDKFLAGRALSRRKIADLDCEGTESGLRAASGYQRATDYGCS